MTTDYAPPFFPEKARKALARHNARWSAMLQNWLSRGGVVWTPGMIVSPGVRGFFDTFLPWGEFSRSLRNVARVYLPGEEWIPRLLGESALPSLLEFWAEIPQYCGRVSFKEEELPSLFCACADPPRFGTDIGRYPGQLDELAQLPFARNGRLLDLGCGVGLGTLEALARLGLAEADGVTQEPLEAWMARNRILPHDPVRSRHFACFSSCVARFTAGSLLEWRGEGGYEVILCNGLAGGRFLQGDEALSSFLKVLEAQLAPQGVVALANHFHEGQRSSVEKLLSLARQRGWLVSGSWQNARLTRRAEGRRFPS